MDENTMRSKFDDKIKSIVQNKREDNNAFLSTDDYRNLIEQVKRSKMCLRTFGEKKTVKDYRTVRKYDILTVDGVERLVRPPADGKNAVLRYVTTDELFDILYETHFAIGHGGRNRMVAELKNQYCNVTNETIMVFLKLCAHCRKKAAHPRRALASGPASLRFAFNSRAQVDVVDMQSRQYDGYCFVMKYVDRTTRFVVLKPLKSKRATEIASNLIDVYTVFGAPAILQSDDGKEFVCSIIDELHTMWNEIKIVYGTPTRGDEGEGFAERANNVVQDMLAAWVTENNSPDWPSALKFIQFKINQTVHSGADMSPYEAMFGYPARTGLASFNLPNDELIKLRTEDDLERITNEPIIVLNINTEQNLELDNSHQISVQHVKSQKPL